MNPNSKTLEAELLLKAKLEDDFNRDLDVVLGKLAREAEEERKLKEEECKLKEEECKLKEEECKLKEEAIRLLYKSGIKTTAIANELNIPLQEVLNILKN